MATEVAARRGRAERRSARAERKARLRYPTLVNKMKFQEVLDEEGLESIHNASMTILEEIGIAFRDGVALEGWRNFGAKVVGDTVFLGRDMVMELIAKAPAEFAMASRNPERSIRIGGRNTVFAPMQGAPNVRDLEGVRRFSTLQDLHDFNKLTQMMPCQHIAGGFIVEANDQPVPHRHLDFVSSNLIHTDMPFFGATTSGERARDSIEMTRIVHGQEFMDDNATLVCQVSGNSPRLWDETMLEAGRIYARAGQVVLMSPFVLASANTPADVAGTIAQLNAEALSGIAYMQVVAPGGKTIYGQYTASISLKTGAPMAGTPEIALVNFAVGQLARKYGLPWRTTGSQASSKLFDAQSGYESAPGMMTAILGGANLILHAGGWDEGGLVNCFAKFVVDCEQNELYHRLGQGIRLDRLDEAVDAVRGIEPSGHYLGADFTMKYFEEAFAMPEILDFSSHPQWTAEGEKDVGQRAREKARTMLASYQAPALDIAIREELDDFVRRRKADINPNLT